jgi:hypothetical protein
MPQQWQQLALLCVVTVTVASVVLPYYINSRPELHGLLSNRNGNFLAKKCHKVLLEWQTWVEMIWEAKNLYTRTDITPEEEEERLKYLREEDEYFTASEEPRWIRPTKVNKSELFGPGHCPKFGLGLGLGLKKS